MIQIQDWKCDKKIVVVDEVNHGTVQVEIPKPGEYKDKYYHRANSSIYNLLFYKKYLNHFMSLLFIYTSYN